MGQVNVVTGVCHSVHRGRGLPSGGEGGAGSASPLHADPTLQARILLDTVNKRAVVFFKVKKINKKITLIVL